MKYYKDKNNKVFAYEADGSQDEFIEKSLIAITETEAMAIANPPLTPEQIQTQANEEARAYLASTDWYVIRLTETGVAIPTEILAARQQARDSVTTSL